MSASTDAAAPWVGRALPRKEDARFTTGRGTYVDDLQRTRLLHAVFVRSPFAHARVRGIDCAAALASPGVRAVFTAADLDVPPLVPRFNRQAPDWIETPTPILASDVVRHVGDPVAVVVADDPYRAEDAAELVEVDWERLPVVATLDDALAVDAPLVQEGTPSNVFFTGRVDVGDVDGELRRAALVVELTVDSGRQSALPMEGRGCLAEWDDRNGQLVLHSSTQMPHILRTSVSTVLGLPEHDVRVIAHDVGGAFGLKCVVSREEVAVAALGLRLRRPVKWIEDRNEHLTASFHAKDQQLAVRAGFDADGVLLAVDADIRVDVGAYSTEPYTSTAEPAMALSEVPGCYRLRHYRATARGVFTNKAPWGPYRGVSRPQTVLVMERLMEEAAARLGLDPIDIRRRNLIRREETPWRSVTGLVYDDGSYRESLDRCAEEVETAGWRDRQQAARAAGRHLGIGISTTAERTGYGTAAFAALGRAVTPGYDVVEVAMDASGVVEIATGTMSHGQGHETTFAQIAADELGIDPSMIRLRQGDTQVVPQGWGTAASRSIVIGGAATKLAARALAAKIREVSAHLIEAAPDDIELAGGSASVKGVPQSAVPLTEIGRLANLHVQHLPDGMEPTLRAAASFDPADGTFSNATHAALVEVDVETGQVHVLDYRVAEDCGVVINPLIVEGQVRGGIAQGIAGALYEEIVYDADGQVLTGSLADYLVPTASEVPVSIPIAHLETPCPYTETGAKGVGEGGTIAAVAAVVNAVNDAMREFGVAFDRTPITPERVWRALRSARLAREA